ncbi:unnamed protein product, partial [Vitis vinifera]
MASLPSVAVTRTPKSESEFRKYSASFLPSEKSPSVSYQRSTQLDGVSEARCLDFREALSFIREGTKVESAFYVPILQECIDKKLTARKVFDELPRRNVVSWTTLMTGYVHDSKPELAVQVFREMLEAGAYPTNYTLGTALSASSDLHSKELGKQIHGYSIKYRIEFDASIGNSLCSLYSKCGSLECAVKAFRRIRDKNVISWTTVISAWGDNGEAATGLQFFVEMLSECVEPNEFTLTSALSLCCVMQSLDIGTQIHSLTIKLGFESNLPIKNSIMYLYLKCGWIHEAKKLFDEMETISLVTWNAMIAGHARMMDFAKDDLAAHQCGTEALSIFLKLNRSGMKPDLFTFSSVLSVCSSLVALEQGEQVHAQTIKTGFLSDVVNGQPQQALLLFEDMRLAGVRPNKITFVGVLSACSHAGMVDEALDYFQMMKNEYKITPVMDHYACLIDMFVRLGRLDEAFDFIKEMDLEPNEFIWSILIAGCRSQGKLELGFYAAEQLLNLKPKDTETYNLLLNMYLSAGKWKEVSRVRKMMKEEKLGRLKDWSWISIKDKIYSFKRNARSHAQSGEMYELLGNLHEKAKSFGYEWEESLEVTDEEEDADEEKALTSIVYHSEKLAIAFGLLNTSNAVPIRVTKSISMCRDCHNFIRIISLLSAREIIIRDSKRLHKFINGHCSCGDFGTLI